MSGNCAIFFLYLKRSMPQTLKKNRPILLLCVISKLLESIYIWGKKYPSYSHLSAVFTSSQSVFFKYLLTWPTYITQQTTNWILNVKKTTFDNIPHDELLSNLGLLKPQVLGVCGLKTIFTLRSTCIINILVCSIWFSTRNHSRTYFYFSFM